AERGWAKDRGSRREPLDAGELTGPALGECDVRGSLPRHAAAGLDVVHRPEARADDRAGAVDDAELEQIVRRLRAVVGDRAAGGREVDTRVVTGVERHIVDLTGSPATSGVAGASVVGAAVVVVSPAAAVVVVSSF